MKTLEIRKLPLINNGSVINLSYIFSNEYMYVVSSNRSEVLISLICSIFYPNDNLIGDVYYCGFNLRDFDKDVYRKSIIAKVGNHSEAFGFLTVREYFKLFTNDRDLVFYYLGYFDFPTEKINKRLVELTNEEKFIIELVVPYVKGSQIILFDLFFDNVDEKFKKKYLKKVKTLSLSLRITVIVFSRLNNWSGDEYLIVKLNRE